MSSKKKIEDTKDIPWKIKKHLVMAYDTLGSYLTVTGNIIKDQAIIDKGHSFSAKAIELSEEKGKIILHSRNASTESYIGKILLDRGEVKEAKERFRGAIELSENQLPAWWWLKEAHEREEDYQKAIECFGRYAEIRDSPSLYGNVRSTARRWMEEGKIPEDLDLLINYSKKAYELDPNGDLDLRNISDYAHDLNQKGKETADQDILKEAKELFMLTYGKYMEIEDKREASYHLWYAAICEEEIEKRIDIETLKRYIESATLGDSELSYTKLKYKVLNYCIPIWKSGQIVDADIASEIESCANRHLEYPATNMMIGIVLQRNRMNERALPYLEKVRVTKDTFVLRALMECYYALEKKQKAEEVCQELYPLLEGKEKRKLSDRASKLGLKCS